MRRAARASCRGAAAVFAGLALAACAHVDGGTRDGTGDGATPTATATAAKPAGAAATPTATAATPTATVASPTSTAAPTPANDTIERLRTTLQVRFPEIQVATIAPAPVGGWYEVVSKSEEIAYVDASGEYLLVGSLLATRGRENLTQKRLLALQSVDFESLPFASAVKVVKGAGARRVAVFADPLCPFCRKLEQTLKDVDDVTVYTFVMPLEELHPGAATTATHIWCADDRAAAWLAWMLDKRAPAAKTCDGDPGESVKQLGDRLRIAGTPTMFFPDGSRLAGAPDAAAFEQELQRRQARAADAVPASGSPRPDAPAPAPARDSETAPAAR